MSKKFDIDEIYGCNLEHFSKLVPLEQLCAIVTTEYCLLVSRYMEIRKGDDTDLILAVKEKMDSKKKKIKKYKRLLKELGRDSS